MSSVLFSEPTHNFQNTASEPSTGDRFLVSVFKWSSPSNHDDSNLSRTKLPRRWMKELSRLSINLHSSVFQKDVVLIHTFELLEHHSSRLTVLSKTFPHDQQEQLKRKMQLFAKGTQLNYYSNSFLYRDRVINKKLLQHENKEGVDNPKEKWAWPENVRLEQKYIRPQMVAMRSNHFGVVKAQKRRVCLRQYFISSKFHPESMNQRHYLHNIVVVL